MNRETVINKQYQVEDVLHQDAFQRIYLAADLFSESRTPVYLTAFKDIEGGLPVTAVFQNFEKELRTIFEDFFLLDNVFYTVSKCCPGKPFPAFITNTMLNPYEKGIIVSNYLNKLMALDPLPLVLKYILSSFGNISILDRKIVCMNHILFFSPVDLEITDADYLQRVGDFLLCVYGNSLYASLEEIRSGVHPEVAVIIERCYHGAYMDVGGVQKDFSPIYFKSRLKQDVRPPIAGADGPARGQTSGQFNMEGDLIMTIDHPDAPERPFLAREKKVGRRSKRVKKMRQWGIIAAALVLLVAGIYGVNRYFQNRGSEDALSELPPAQESPESPATDPDDLVQIDIEPEAGAEPEDPGTSEPYIIYTVQPGDSFYRISQTYYGDGGRYPEIMAYNNIADPTALFVGQEILVPND